MEKHGIVPDVINKAPSEILKVTYEGVSVNNGNTLTPTQVKDQPKVEWNADSKCYYTLFMTDPDAPSRSNPEAREVLHWLVVNIPGNDVSKGEILSDYIGSGPPKGTGLHRYVFLVFKQKSKQAFDEPSLNILSRENRRKFSTLNFAKKYDLGNAMFGNLYQAEWDDYVPLLHAKFTK